MINFSKKINTLFLYPLVFSLLFFVSACDFVNTVDELIIPDQHTGLYVIKKGKHSSNNLPKKINTKLIRFEAKFDSTAIYKTKLSANQGDINKLYGVSDCGSQHHTNSTRFGWRWYNDQLEIFAYTYVNKKRDSKFIRAIQIGKSYTYELRLEDKQYILSVDNVKVVMPRECNGTSEGYVLYPYFGGDEVAPHDVRITIKNLL